MLVKTEDGRVFQADNCGVDYWWLGLEFKPTSLEAGSLGEDAEVASEFENWKTEVAALDKLYWHTFTFAYRWDYDVQKWLQRPVWYNYKTNAYETYLCDTMPNSYTVTYRGLPGKVISMAGYYNADGYVEIKDLIFE